MACLKPVPMRGRWGPCSRCEACRRSRAAVAALRLEVEAFGHDAATMLTLTYARNPVTLVPGDALVFRKRFRRLFEYHCLQDRELRGLPAAELARRSRLRFFTVGEYSPRGRPHLHVACFGADRSTVVNGRSLHELVQAAWGLGRTHPGRMWSPAVAGYLSGYIVKGFNVRGLDVLGDRVPEFSRWPQRPGLGVPGLHRLLPLLIGDRDGRAFVAAHGDVPSIVRLGDRDRVLGRFLLDRLRAFVGLSADEVRALKERVKLAESGELLERALDVALEEALSVSDFELADLVSARLSCVGGAYAVR